MSQRISIYIKCTCNANNSTYIGIYITYITFNYDEVHLGSCLMTVPLYFLKLTFVLVKA